MGMTSEPRFRNRAELALPGALVGVFSGAFAGLLALLGGQPPSWATVNAVTLALPLALLGAGYGLLLTRETFRPGVFAPAAVYWFAGFPLARLGHEACTDLVLSGRVAIPGGAASFLLFQALVSVGFAIGFLWVHERIMPRWLLRVQDHNPGARRLLAHYLQLAEHVRRAKKRKHGNREKDRDTADTTHS